MFGPGFLQGASLISGPVTKDDADGLASGGGGVSVKHRAMPFWKDMVRLGGSEKSLVFLSSNKV